MKLRLGVIGIGNDGSSRHLAALRAVSDRLEVRAVCEPISHRALQFAQELEIDAVDGFRALARREDIDAIAMLSGGWYGSLPILAACDAGKAIYSAAPLHINPEDAHRIKQRVEKAGVAYMAEFPRRQAPATLRLQELIATHLGAPRLVFSHRRKMVSEPNGQPRESTTRELLEVVDWCRYVIGREATSAFGVAHHSGPNAGLNDYEMMSVDFSPPGEIGTGPLAQISCGQYIPAGWEEAGSFRLPAELQVVCERGVAFVDLPATLIWFDSAGRHMESLESDRPASEQLLLHFYRSVTSLIRNTSSLEDAYRALLVVLAAQRSVREGCRVEIEQ